ncbi:Uma2 family endonuclease [Spirulina sp. CCNP1310]|uniref:Uma2 family endonuclease n=1 Tax=Spirulina sp. CCNP1310 TaxID=3110249 RepID=UPI002B216E22|nr:Uma2 family endonuclease [Spirulina sp. CCNP1310]MEA5420195.1 Uma2 family endonuclease [Spirulina sp. CCNP1310]
MTNVLTQKLTLAEFLERPDLEESPAWEYVAGHIVQKPMPKFRHSLLQKRLLSAIDDPLGHYLALPELRCTFGNRSIVPDVVVIALERIQLNDLGEPQDSFTQAPDWAIEILSPDQSTNRVIDNLLHCLNHGSRLGWLVDPHDYSVLILNTQQEIKICRAEQSLPVLPEINVELTAQDVFGWLKLGKNG